MKVKCYSEGEGDHCRSPQPLLRLRSSQLPRKTIAMHRTRNKHISAFHYEFNHELFKYPISVFGSDVSHVAIDVESKDNTAIIKSLEAIT